MATLNNSDARGGVTRAATALQINNEAIRRAEAHKDVTRIIGRENDSHLSPGEARRVFGVSDTTLREWVKEKRVPAIKVAGRLVFRRPDIEAILARAYTDVTALDAFWEVLPRWLSLEEVQEAAPDHFGGATGAIFLREVIGLGFLYFRTTVHNTVEVHSAALHAYLQGLPAGLDDGFVPPEERDVIVDWDDEDTEAVEA